MFLVVIEEEEEKKYKVEEMFFFSFCNPRDPLEKIYRVRVRVSPEMTE
jgi:hypothetical protein